MKKKDEWVSYCVDDLRMNVNLFGFYLITTKYYIQLQRVTQSHEYSSFWVFGMRK